MTSLIGDRLRVFVSSTIKECAAERTVVRNAILSINHDPILFEDVGARPHPPRDVYMARLELSQIFIGIYRESYGWTAPDMDVSGLEDEYRLASTRGMDRLIYIYEKPSSREPKLQILIDEAKNAGITVARYSDPVELEDRVRNDLTAVISSRFVDQAGVLQEAANPADVLESIVPNPVHRLRRPDVEGDLIDKLNAAGRVVVTAPIGGGKTILLAQMSEENGWVFVDGQGLSRVDMLARAANAFRNRLGRPLVPFTTEPAAIKELVKNWNELPDVTLVVDGASNPMVLWEVAAGERPLVVSSRSALDVPSIQRMDVPALTGTEIDTWVTALRGKRPDPSELARLVDQSGGSPLYLRFYALGGGTAANLTLQELEIRAVQSLPPRAKEITSYLAMSFHRFSLGDLQALMSADGGPEAVGEQVSIANGLLGQMRGRVMLVHEHLRATILDQLHQSPPRLAFFASRLGQFFEDSERYLAAFHVYLDAGEPRRADRVVERAAMQAMLTGGGARAIRIFKRQVELAQERGALENQMYALLHLAYAFKQTGAKAEACGALAQAREIAERLNEAPHYLRVREMEALLDISDKLRSERIADLNALRDACMESGDQFNAARTGTLLTAEYISGGNFRNAVKMAREDLQIFDELGDEHGNRAARLNLTSALSGLEGREDEAASIAHELQQELDPEEFPRERAVLCNYLTRRYRESSDTVRAAAYAQEAIEIGEQLGDRHVVAINRITLGNVRRDENKLDQALIEYHLAEHVAVTAGLRDSEAAANELIASIHNEREEFTLALHHAQHAVAVARLVGDHVLIARAEEERAIALKGQRDLDQAIGAYTNAANELSSARPGGSFFVSLIGDALHLCATSERIDLKVRLLKSVFGEDAQPGDENIHALHALYSALPRMADSLVTVDRVLPIVALSMADLLADVPQLVERRIVLQATDALLPRGSALPNASRLSAVAAILMAQSGESLTIGDVADIAESLAAGSDRIYFKPQPDGAGHWTLRLEIANGVVVSIVQLDDRPRTAITTTVLALLLSGLDHMIREQLLGAERMPRQEAIINVACRKDFERQIGSELLELGDMPNGFVVAESTDVTQSNQPPMFVVCMEQCPTPWRPNEHALSDVHLLLGEVLRILVGHLLARAVEPEVLLPKIGSIIRRIGYRGPAVHAYPRE